MTTTSQAARDQDHRSMSTPEAMAQLGVTEETLTAEQREHLDTHGYLPLINHMPDGMLEELRARTDELLALEGQKAGHETPQGPGVTALADLINKGEVFERLFTDPTVVAAAWHVLGDNVRVNSLNYRASLPGEGHQGLHGDWPGAVADGDFHILNSMWILDDFTDDNGATRAVPGSHRSGRAPADDLDGDPKRDHPDQVLLTAPAGSVVIFNAHVWHGGTQNRTDRPRRGMTMSYRRRDEPQQLDQAAYLRKAVWDRLSPAARYLLGV
jgi:hypothetical protein